MMSLFFSQFAFQRASLQLYRNNSVAMQEMGSFHSDTEVTTIDTSLTFLVGRNSFDTETRYKQR